MSTLTAPIPAAALTTSGQRQWPVVAALALALFASGAAGLVNQVIWQRALRVFLGGSETVCSMVVVLVFMAGLGAGSVWMSRRVGRVTNPLRTFGFLEGALAAVNVGVCLLLASDLTSSVYALQRLAAAAGVPLLALYAILATAVLAVPCWLMGATMPLAAESCQRSLGLRDTRVLGWIYGVNTLGSVLGTVVASGWMIAEFGQSRSLLAAAGLNAVAGGLLFALSRRAGHAPAAAAMPSREARGWRPSRAEVLAFGLGFCSLGYEMYLFRLVPLRHQPLPFTFAAVLAGFLLFWSVGAALAGWRFASLGQALRLAALACIASLAVYAVDRLALIEDTWTLAAFLVTRSAYFVPCLLFGYLFSLVTQDAARSWGRDVGRISAWNTLGACLGTVAMTFVGYEVPFFLMAVVLGLLLVALQEFAEASESGFPRWSLPLGASAVAVAVSLALPASAWPTTDRIYSGRDGVLFVTPDRQVVWDGLWHSQLSDGGDHVGNKNWFLATCPALCHPTGEIRDVCVIGVCTGISTGTFAKLASAERVDGYDITHVLKSVYADYPDGTLNVATDPKVNLIWQDARTGLALNPQRYDVIMAQPLYLKQSGSAQLNSVEFLRLVKDRLKPDGVFCLYSNGTAEQAFLLRETADRVFPHRETFFNGYLLVLSSTPIDLSESALAARLARRCPFWDEVRGHAATATPGRIRDLLDVPALPAGDGELVVTDDFPLLEYPKALAARLAARRYPFALPPPR